MLRTDIGITLRVNGQEVRSGAETLADLLDEQGFGERKVATALNGDFVPQHARTKTTLTNGDRIEIVSARQGG